ncbi:unnamed protein product, partial [Mesorhabditis spiculigera]
MQKVVPTYVTQLVDGYIQRIKEGMKIRASVSLIFDSGYYILFDSPSATDVDSKSQMLRGLTSRNLAPGHIQMIVTSHGHPDHFGQGNFFPNARHFFGSYEYSDDTYIQTELAHNETMRITPNVEIWNTPGHTNQDISVIVRNVPCCGTVAVVGDLFYTEQDATNGTDWYADAWNPLIGKINRNKVLCASNYIIPGHGPLFKISEEMRKNADCPSNGTLNNSENPYVDITQIGGGNKVEPATKYLAQIADASKNALNLVMKETEKQKEQTRGSVVSTVASENPQHHPKSVLEASGGSYLLPHGAMPVESAITLATATVSPVERMHAYLQSEAEHNDPSLIMPVVETAAVQLARALNVKVVNKDTSYPYSDFWKKAFSKLAHDPAFQTYFQNPTNPSARRAARQSIIGFLNTGRGFRQG